MAEVAAGVHQPLPSAAAPAARNAYRLAMYPPMPHPMAASTAVEAKAGNGAGTNAASVFPPCPLMAVAVGGASVAGGFASEYPPSPFMRSVAAAAAAAATTRAGFPLSPGDFPVMAVAEAVERVERAVAVVAEMERAENLRIKARNTKEEAAAKEAVTAASAVAEVVADDQQLKKHLDNNQQVHLSLQSDQKESSEDTPDEQQEADDDEISWGAREVVDASKEDAETTDDEVEEQEADDDEISWGAREVVDASMEDAETTDDEVEDVDAFFATIDAPQPGDLSIYGGRRRVRPEQRVDPAAGHRPWPRPAQRFPAGTSSSRHPPGR